MDKSSDTIIDEISKLTHHIQFQLPDSVIILSSAVTRTDNGKARLTVNHTIRKIKKMNVAYV